jgi:2-oxo-4-hydroxy-4-carboxy-5-ureidoimidazoline decarboxylase
MGVPALTRINALPAEIAEKELMSCCASPAWARAMVAGRPYPDPGALTAAGRDALAGLPWDEIARALDAHPRLGERAAGADREAAWSRQEQAGVSAGDRETLADLAAANRAYEDRFDRVLLICATGRDGADLLAVARQRLGNDEATERRVIREELGRIVALRLVKLAGAGEAVAG